MWGCRLQIINRDLESTVDRASSGKSANCIQGNSSAGMFGNLRLSFVFVVFYCEGGATQGRSQWSLEIKGSSQPTQSVCHQYLWRYGPNLWDYGVIKCEQLCDTIVCLASAGSERHKSHNHVARICAKFVTEFHDPLRHFLILRNNFQQSATICNIMGHLARDIFWQPSTCSRTFLKFSFILCDFARFCNMLLCEFGWHVATSGSLLQLSTTVSLSNVWLNMDRSYLHAGQQM